MISCPQCSGLSTVPIAYGKPGPELERASQRGLVVLGGCVVDPANPTMKCLDYGHAWVRRQPPPNEGFHQDAVAWLSKLEGQMACLTTNYGNTCVRYARAAFDGSEEEAECYTEMMRAHAEIDRTWAHYRSIATSYLRDKLMRKNDGSQV